MNSENYQEVIKSLHSKEVRFKNVQKIRVSLLEEEENHWVLSIVQDLVKAVLDDSSQLKSIILWHQSLALSLSLNLSSVHTDLLVGAISGLENVRLTGTELTSEKLTGILTELSVVKDHKLKTLKLSWNDLRSVPTDILVAGISGLEVVWLQHTKLTREQLTGIYRMLADRRSSSLRQIILWGIDISEVSQDLRNRAALNESVRIFT